MRDKKYYISLFWLPLFICIYGSIELGIAIFKTGSLGENKWKFVAVSLFVLIIWLVLCVRDYKKNQVDIDYNGHNFLEAILIVSAFLIIAFYCVGICWNTGYMTLDPVGKINNGTIHIDTVFHSAYSEGYSSGFPTTNLINGNPFLPYHTFSHLVIWFLAKILRTNAYLIFNYVYGIVFIPIYLFLQLLVIKCAKSYFCNVNKLVVLDYMAILLINIGLYPFENIAGVWRESFIVSQSFMIALSVMLLFYCIAFKQMTKERQSKIFMFLGIPIFMFLSTWSKVSVGVILTGSVMYYIFRKDPFGLKNWGLIVYYGVIFLVSIQLSYIDFFAKESAAHSKGSITLFAFASYCGNAFAYLGHFMFLALPAFVFVVIEFIKFKRGGKWNMWIELVTIITIVGFLPVVLMDIPGGSAAYFSYVVQFPGIILLCGNDYLNIGKLKNKNMSRAMIIKASICIILISGMCGVWQVGISTPASVVANSHEKGLYSELMEVRGIVQHAPSEYLLYVDSHVNGKLFRNPGAEVFVYPGLIGCDLINGSYEYKGEYFSFNDMPVENYGMNYVKHGKLTFDDAKDEAIKMGKKHIIHIIKGGYEIIELY